jgi:glycosyltransferase involved in cell wall biosynthesis
MKIVRVIARLNVGGPAKHVVWLSSGLHAPDYESVLVAGTVPAGEEDMGYFAAANKVTPIFIPEMSREISLKDAVTVWKLFKLFRREKPDIVHTHTAKAGTVGRFAGLLYSWFTPQSRPRFIHTYHGHIFHSYYGKLKTRIFLSIEKLLARLTTDRIVVLSEQQQKEINEQFGVGRAEQFAIVPLGLDLNEFAGWQNRRQAFRDEVGAKVDDVLVGIVGRLTEVKNHAMFLRAAKIFNKEFAQQFAGRSVTFVVVGDGALRPQLEQEGADCVKFVGNRRDVENIYPAFDIVALTSWNEGTPLTLIEAMANGRTVIATAVGGVVDLLGPVLSNQDMFQICERGLSVKSNDARGLAAGLSSLVEDSNLRRETAERGLQFVTANYSRERLLRDIKRLYADITK